MTVAAAGPSSPRQLAWARRRRSAARFSRQLLSDRAGVAGLAVLVFFVVVALAAPLLVSASELSATAGRGNPDLAPPSAEFPLGTDEIGRSVLAQLIWGARISLFIGVVATLVAVVIGSTIGVTAGFVGGRTERLLMAVDDWFLVIPFLPLAIVLAAVLGSSATTLAVVIGVTSWAGSGRLLRAQVLSVKERLFIERSRALGASGWHIVTRHVLPHTAPLILANAILTVPGAILAESTLAFLGFGDRLQPSWGKMLEGALSSGALDGRRLVVLLASRPVHRGGGAGLHGRGSGPRTHPRPPAGRPAHEPMTGSAVLAVRDLHVTYHSSNGDVPAVRGVNLDVHEGETVGVAGESGCGKSTMAMALLRLLPAGTRTEGEILLDGEDVLAMRAGRLRAVRWAGASIVFQGAQHALNPVQRIGDQITEALRVHKVKGTTAGSLLELVGLPTRRADAYPHELSGGQKQRVMIAMALACDPRLLIADEPTTALDVMVQAQVLALLESIQAERGLATIFITHDLSVLSYVADRLVVMYAGRVAEEGPAAAVLDDPQHPYTRALAGAFPTIGDSASRFAPTGLPGDPPDPAAVPPGCPFHPRCPVVIDACPLTDVELRPVGDGDRRAACLLVPTIAGTVS